MVGLASPCFSYTRHLFKSGSFHKQHFSRAAALSLWRSLARLMFLLPLSPLHRPGPARKQHLHLSCLCSLHCLFGSLAGSYFSGPCPGWLIRRIYISLAFISGVLLCLLRQLGWAHNLLLLPLFLAPHFSASLASLDALIFSCLFWEAPAPILWLPLTLAAGSS